MKSLLLIFSTALAPVIWGSTYIVTSELLPADKPFLAGFMRAFPAGLLLLLISRCWPRPKEWGKLFLLSFLNISCFQVMLFIAAYRLPGGLVLRFSEFDTKGNLIDQTIPVHRIKRRFHI